MLHEAMIYEYPQVERIVVIGDIHGDFKRFKRILTDAKIINTDLEWIADPSNTIVLQMGDQVDSANRVSEAKDWEVLRDIDMLYFTNSLDNIAQSKGGRVISLIGNHELMNVLGNFMYVSPKSNFPDRYKYFKPKGTLCTILAKRPIVVKIGKLFFCHAGIKKRYFEILEKENRDISYLNDVWKKIMLSGEIVLSDKDIFEQIIMDQDGILWTRNIDTEENLNYVLEKLQCQYIFVGHTASDTIHIVKDKIIYTDNGISRAFGSTKFQYIEIQNQVISIKEIVDI